MHTARVSRCRWTDYIVVRVSASWFLERENGLRDDTWKTAKVSDFCCKLLYFFHSTYIVITKASPAPASSLFPISLSPWAGL